MSPAASPAVPPGSLTLLAHDGLLPKAPVLPRSFEPQGSCFSLIYLRRIRCRVMVYLCSGLSPPPSL